MHWNWALTQHATPWESGSTQLYPFKKRGDSLTSVKGQMVPWPLGKSWDFSGCLFPHMWKGGLDHETCRVHYNTMSSPSGFTHSHPQPENCTIISFYRHINWALGKFCKTPLTTQLWVVLEPGDSDSQTAFSITTLNWRLQEGFAHKVPGMRD